MIWLIGGTSESKQLAIALQERGIPFVVTVVTDTARGMYSPNACVRVGKLDSSTMTEFIQTNHITAILDASHPFAIEISHGAIAQAQTHQIPYLRFEREDVLLESNNLRIANSIEDAIQPEILDGQNVFLAVGYQSLHLFRNWHDRCRLYARVLPAIASLQAALDADFRSEQIVAIRPPISVALERALWQQWQITTVITKASGKSGGEDLKIAIAAELGIQLIAIARPQLDYPRQTNSIRECVLFCAENIAFFNV
ncbi:cobalt-precorrin-6A reductase [Pseudanabaena sp. PCC 6802]|uniref:cobalt-precorrin-6A reductase n=1 Tax=Pseudanabaena sp. PCC 6802 TaxID=118173 RepID=UPI0003476853|nr:cobalt-precorrin-6A reductase [Pseudanabaena sp. PCC 6802]